MQVSEFINNFFFQAEYKMIPEIELIPATFISYLS